MKKILKFFIGGTACFILFLYFVSPLVTIGEEYFSFWEYIKYIFTNISEVLKNGNISQIDMLHIVVVWLVVLVIIVVPVLCLLVVAVKGILSGLFTRKNLKVITAELLSFAFSGFLIGFSYYLVNKYTLPMDANYLQKEFVKIACYNIWQPLLYISAFGSLLLSGLTIYVNSLKKKKEDE